MSADQPERGVLYIALGQPYYDEACQSARSLRRHMPDIPITLYTDQPPSDLFDTTHQATSCGDPWQDKITLMANLPYERTLFLDTDTYICGSVEDVFNVLDRFDVAAAPDAKRLTNPHAHVPPTFSEMNTGVLAFRRSEQVQAFFSQWLDRYLELKPIALPHDKGDQPAFRWALYESDLRLATLPMAYHCRYLSAGLLDGEVRILHGREVNQFHEIARVEQTINRAHGLRVFVAGHVYAFQRSSPFFAGRTVRHVGRFTRRIGVVTWVHLRDRVRQHGWRKTLGFVWRRFLRLKT